MFHDGTLSHPFKQGNPRYLIQVGLPGERRRGEKIGDTAQVACYRAEALDCRMMLPATLHAVLAIQIWESGLA